MIVFRPNVQSYMPGVDIVNRPVVEPAASDWWLAGGTIDAANVIYHGDNVASATHSGTTLTGNWSWAAKFTAAQPGSNTMIMDSSTDGGKDYWLRHNSFEASITLLAPDGSVVASTADGVRVVFLVVDEVGGTAKVYIDNVEQASQPTSTAGEFLGGGSGVIWNGSMYTNADYLLLVDEALDATQRAALYSSMTA